jgi:hypothetical protein
VKNYLESYHIWDQSRSFNVVAKNTAFLPNPSSVLGATDGQPDPVYEPANQAPEIFRWRGYWISVVRFSLPLPFNVLENNSIDILVFHYIRVREKNMSWVTTVH